MASVTLIDYGVGNIKAFTHIYTRLNLKVEIATNASQIINAERLILPGVGAFDWAMKQLNQSGMRNALDEQVLGHKKPILGVCVGMQMMAHNSEEGQLLGLNWIKARVEKFKFTGSRHFPLPHMGWNEAVPTKSDPLFNGIVDPRFYFLHSYVVVPDQQDSVLAHSQYNSNFASAIKKDNIYGTQNQFAQELCRSLNRVTPSPYTMLADSKWWIGEDNPVLSTQIYWRSTECCSYIQ
jgi:imidazole glycerol-phosphate synthase subunit HisH